MPRGVTRQRLTNLMETFAKCQEVNGKLEFYANEKRRSTHAYFQRGLFLERKDDYNEAVDFMAGVLDTFESLPASAPPAGDTSSFFNSGRTFRLPKINLPTFDGSFDKWESFCDRFTAMIKIDSTLSNVERLHYLYSCVKGDASNALNHVAITDANFAVTWNILHSCYENKRRLITEHLQTLLNLSPLSSETAKDLRQLRDQTNTAIQALKKSRTSD